MNIKIYWNDYEMPKIFEIVDPIKYHDFLVDLNKFAGEEGLVIDKNMLLSALSASQYYIDITDKISSIVRSVVKNHPFSNGNKRTACLVFLLLSNAAKIKIKLSKNELEDIIVDIAKNNYSVDEISKLLFG